MKRSFNPSRFLPLGEDWDRVKSNLLWGYVISGLWTLMVPFRYYDARAALFTWDPNRLGPSTEKILIPGVKIVPYPELWLHGPLFCFWCFLAYLAIGVFSNYRSHYMDSRSIYTMRRLPNRWELHRRCWTVPILAALAGAVLMGLLAGLYYWMYLALTPDGCLP